MTRIKSLLEDYREVATTTVTVGNGDILLAKGVVNISFKTEHGYVTFTGVLHGTGLGRSLISVPQLTSKDLTMRMVKDNGVISGKQGHVMTVKKSGSFYSSYCYIAQVAVTETATSKLLLHYRTCLKIDFLYLNQRTRRRTSEARSVTRVHFSSLHWMSIWKV